MKFSSIKDNPRREVALREGRYSILSTDDGLCSVIKVETSANTIRVCGLNPQRESATFSACFQQMFYRYKWLIQWWRLGPLSKEHSPIVYICYFSSFGRRNTIYLFKYNLFLILINKIVQNKCNTSLIITNVKDKK